MISYPVFDFHCDLMACVGSKISEEIFLDPFTHCSLLQLRKGGIRSQIFTIFTTSEKGCTKEAKTQIDRYQYMLKHCSEYVSREPKNKEEIKAYLAIENTSALVEEDEPLDLAFQRLCKIEEVQKIVYISLTWKFENRFGGGDQTKVGLKEDGKALLDFLSGHFIAVDLSHTNDLLAGDILNYIDQKNLQIPIIASHSNMRSVCNINRNLPDEFVQEIILRKGVIGLNLVKKFVGKQITDFVEHIFHAIELGAEAHLVLGLDFFGGPYLPGGLGSPEEEFFSGFSDPSCLPKLFVLLKQIGISCGTIKALSNRNAKTFMRNLSLKDTQAIAY